MLRFARLRDRVSEETRDLLRKLLKETKKMINTAIDIEMAYINKAHPDFIGPKLLLSKEHTEPTSTKYDIEDIPKSSGGFFSFFWGPQKKVTKTEKKEDNFEAVFENINEREKTQIRIMRQLLDSYCTIVKKNIQDRITKIIMHFLVISSINSLPEVLHVNIYKQGKFNSNEAIDLLKEDTEISVKRKVCKKELEALQNAKKVLSEISDL